MTVLLNVTEALFAAGDANRIERNELVALKDAFIHACDRYVETFAEDELTEEVNEQLSNYSSEQLQFYIRIVSLFNTPNVTRPKQDVAPGADNFQRIITLMSLPKIELKPFGGDSVDYYNCMAEFDKLVDDVTDDAQVKLNILKRSCVDYAANVITDCGQLDAVSGYKRARELLAGKCGNPHRASQQIQRELRDGKVVRSFKDLDALSMCLRKGIDCLTHIGMLSELNSQNTIKAVISMVQFRNVSDGWRRQALRILDERNSYPHIDDLRRFLDKEVRDLSDPVYGIADVSSGTHASFNTLITGIPQDDGTSRFSGNFTTEQHERVSPSSAAIQSANASSQPAGARSRSVPHSRTVSVAQCPYCGNDTHKLLKCEQFHVLSVSDRNAFVKENRICMLCLNVGHFVRDCLSRYRCLNCQRRHSRSLCGHGNGGNTVGDNNHDNLQNIHQNEQVALSVSTSGVFMPLVRVLVNGVLCVALLDSGSSRTFLTQDMADRLGLVGVDVSFNLSRLNSITQMHTKTATVQVQAANMAGNVYACNVCFTDYIPAHVPPSFPGVYAHLEGFSLCQRAERIDLLIGQDHAELLMPHEVRSGLAGAPYAVRSTLGWTLHGSIAGQSPQPAMCMFTFSDMPDKVSQDDLHVIKHWDANTKTVDGHYEIPVPWIDSTFIPPETRYMAKVRHDALCVRLNAKPEIKVMYNKAMDTMLNNGYAEEVPPAEPPSGRTWYLPHNHVYNRAKPDKVRVVFDCAARSRGISLNDLAYQGPNLTTLLNDVLLNYRLYPYIISGDVQAMYNQVKLPVEDRDMMRFLWNGRVYRMTSHLFGGIWCASSAVYALRRVTQDADVHLSDDAISAIRTGFYVDDLLLSYACPNRALSVWNEVKEGLATRGFNVTKFVTNDPSLLASIPDSERAKEVTIFSEQSITKTLGMRWNVAHDILFYVFPSTPVETTRRSMLSTNSSIFDPLGLLSPWLIYGKALLQEVTTSKFGWDEPVPSEVAAKWQRWLTSLRKMDFHIPRCIIPGETVNVELHVCADASTIAYGACAYLCVIDRDGEVGVTLVMSKCKIMPVKTLTIPRAELQAAVMASIIGNYLMNVLKVEISAVHYYTDSTAVLHWLSHPAKRYHIYVANRVQCLLSNSDATQWHYITTGMNSGADLLSRGAEVVSDVDAWFYVPKFLSAADICLPQPLHEETSDETVSSLVIAETDPNVFGPIFSYYSSWTKIIIIIIYTTYIAPYIWPVWPFIGAEEGPSKY